MNVNPSTTSRAQIVMCPSCRAPLVFHESHAPCIDACGFESHSLECRQCGAALAGLIDPFDDALLLSETAASAYAAGISAPRAPSSRRAFSAVPPGKVA
jgi:hypothetical protein